MTNKQTIIDEVDVSGCEYLYTDSRYNDKCCSASVGGNCLCKPSEMLCVKYVECLKVQLKRKEQECENLKQYNDSKQASYESMQRQWNEVELENRKLKKENEELKIEIKQQRQNVADSDVFATFCYDEEQRLKQTLAEIKEIAEKRVPCYLNIDKAKSLTEVEYDYAGKIYNLEQRMYKILQKISECEVNDDMENN